MSLWDEILARSASQSRGRGPRGAAVLGPATPNPLPLVTTAPAPTAAPIARKPRRSGVPALTPRSGWTPIAAGSVFMPTTPPVAHQQWRSAGSERHLADIT